MKKKLVLWLTGAAIMMIAGGGVWRYFPASGPAAVFQSVRQFGPLRLGEGMPTGTAGDYTFAPLQKIPPSKFYVVVVHDGWWCSMEDCGIDGAYVGTMGGWLQTEKPNVFPDVTLLTGLDREENKGVHSLVIVGDRNGKMVGIYPHRGLQDVLPILRLHPDLADFRMLEGVQEFGTLKVGQPSPLQSGDDVARFGGVPLRHDITHIPAGKKFYLFSIQNRKYDMVGGYEKENTPYENTFDCYLSGCRYPEPDPPHDFLFAYIEDLGGWFFSAEEDNADMPRLFGMSPEAVRAGTSSLVVLADGKGIIRALHPGKTLSDALTILSQHPDLADMSVLYPPARE